MNCDVPTEPEAPGRLSTMMVWSRRSDSLCAIRRAMVSVGPPTGKATTIFTGLLGQDAARAGSGSVAADSADRADTFMKVRRVKGVWLAMLIFLMWMSWWQALR